MLLPLDLVPHGLRKAVGSKVVTISGRDLLRHMLQDFENAVEHAGQEARAAAVGPDGQEAGEPAAGEAAEPSDL